jgi:Fe-S-cluster containining protein
MFLKYPETVFECINCGLCCRDAGRHVRRIVLTPEDADRIAQATHLALEGFSKITNRASAPFFRIVRKESGTCIFLDSNSMCRIYNSRPLICRCYPFPVEIDEKTVTFANPTKDCPGVGRGARLPKEYFEKLAEEVIRGHKSSRKVRLRFRSQ